MARFTVKYGLWLREGGPLWRFVQRNHLRILGKLPVSAIGPMQCSAVELYAA